MISIKHSAKNSAEMVLPCLICRFWIPPCFCWFIVRIEQTKADLQNTRDHHRRDGLCCLLFALPDSFAYRHPNAALVIGTLHIAGGIDLQHGAAVCHELSPLVRIPLLPYLRVQALQRARRISARIPYPRTLGISDSLPPGGWRWNSRSRSWRVCVRM